MQNFKGGYGLLRVIKAPNTSNLPKRNQAQQVLRLVAPVALGCACCAWLRLLRLVALVALGCAWLLLEWAVVVLQLLGGYKVGVMSMYRTIYADNALYNACYGTYVVRHHNYRHTLVELA